MTHDVTVGHHEELRRVPRVRNTFALAWLRMRVNAEVLDISGGGALIQIETPCEVGARGTLHLMLGRVPFTGDVVVRHVAGVPAGKSRMAYRVGAAFVRLNDDSRQAIEQWKNR